MAERNRNECRARLRNAHTEQERARIREELYAAMQARARPALSRPAARGIGAKWPRAEPQW
jgi:hypothetical protein